MSRALASADTRAYPCNKKCPGGVDAPRGVFRGEWTATDAATLPVKAGSTASPARRHEPSKRLEGKMAAKQVKTNVPGVYERGSRFSYTYRDRGKQRWGSAATKAEARQAKAERETDAARGELPATSREGFGEYARRWIASYQGRTNRGFRENTRAQYADLLARRIIPYFDHERRLRLAEIEPRDVRDFIAWLAKQPNPHRKGRLLAASTIREHVMILKALLATATEDGVLRRNPAQGVRTNVPEGIGTGREAPDDVRALGTNELGSVLHALPETWWLFFTLLVHTGLRIGEAVELRWKDIVFGSQPRVQVRRQYRAVRRSKHLDQVEDLPDVAGPKSEAGRRDIPLSASLARELWTRRDAREDLVFTTKTGKRINRGNLDRDVLGPAVARAGVPWATFHTFRHTCASLLFTPVEHGGGGKNIRQVSTWLGHADPAFTLRRYVHLIDGGLGTADFLDAAVKPAPNTITSADVLPVGVTTAIVGTDALPLARIEIR